MDSRRRFRPRFVCVMTPQGTLEQRRSGCVDWPSNRVERRKAIETGPQASEGNLERESSGVDSREKLGGAVHEASVP
jgi:hypothetical protein